MSTITQLELEIIRHKRLRWLGKKEDKLFHEKEIKRITNQISRYKTKSKKELEKDIVYIYERVAYCNESKELMTKTFVAKARKYLLDGRITEYTFDSLKNDCLNIFTSSKVRQKYFIE